MTRTPLIALMLAAAALSAWASAAGAQGFPTPPGVIPGAAPPRTTIMAPQRQMPANAQSQTCMRLEAQLASIERGGDPRQSTDMRRYEDALNRQQAELDRITDRSRRLGCQGGGFFSLFTGQAPECAPLNRQIQQMHANIDRMTNEMQRLQGPSAGREGERAMVLDALARNDCGPQYRSAAANQQRGLFESLFGPGSVSSPAQPEPSQSSTYRTVCVRTCDGFYFPISFSTVPSRFPEDERTCQRLCPAAQVMLFTFHNPGQDVSQATSLNGTPYTELPNAFAYRKQFNPSCSCKHVGETWAHALQNLDDTIERGDIVVTDERAKQLSQPQGQRAPRRNTPAQSQSQGGAAAPQPHDAASGDTTTAAPGEQTVRSVGPTFLPKQ